MKEKYRKIRALLIILCLSKCPFLSKLLWVLLDFVLIGRTVDMNFCMGPRVKSLSVCMTHAALKEKRE